MDLLIVVTLAALAQQWQWVLGSLFAGAFVFGAYAHLLKHAHESYRMYLVSLFTLSVAWLVFEFWSHCAEWADGGSSPMHIGMPPFVPFALGALAFLIGGGVLLLVKRLASRPPANYSSTLP